MTKTKILNQFIPGDSSLKSDAPISDPVLLLEAYPAAVYTCDAKGFIKLYNKAAVELWGREPEVGKDLWCGSWKIFYSNGTTPLPLELCPMALTLKNGIAVTGKEIVILRPDGEKRSVQPHPTPIFNAKGELTGAVNVLIDVTDRKIAEQKAASLAAIVHSSDDAIISKTLTSIVTSWNTAAQRMFGYTAGEMIGESITKLIPEDRLDEEPHIIDRLKRGERVEHFETKRITKDRKLIDISLTISPVRDNQGNIIGISKIARDITEQKKLTEQLRENDQRLRMAIEATKLGTWEYNPSAEHLIWSDECRNIYGVPKEMEVDFAFFAEHIYPDDKTMVDAEIQKAMDPSGEGNYDVQYRIIRYSDKKPSWIRAQGKVFFDANRKVERFIGTVLDIDDEKEKEQELKNSFEMFQNMAHHVPAMIWMSGNDTFGDYFNNTWLEFRGRTLDQESNEGWLEGLHPDDVKKCISMYNASYHDQKGFYTEYRLKRHDGQYRWVSDNCAPRYSPNGEFIGFISACIDIDDQKKVREKIQDSELLFKTISNASPAALWMSDAKGQNVFVNETWVKWTGKTLDQQGDHGWFTNLLEQDRIPVLEKFLLCTKSQTYFSAEFRFSRADGEIRWGFTEAEPYYDINGNFSGYAGSVTDITDFKKLEQRKDDFIKMASHELKTPITSITGYVQLLLNIYNEQNDQKLQTSKSIVKSSLGTISKQVNKLTRLVSELLDLSRIESGKLELHKTKFDLSGLVEETVQDIRHTTSNHALILHNDFEGSIVGDKDRIAQVLINLLTNAIKYSPEAGSVEITLSGDKKRAILKVKDFGIGIDKNDQERIFERFYRVEGKSEQTYPGFGIGLFIASEIVNRHFGTITVESEKGKGSVFTVLLPRKPEV